jgi:ASC-1-like (ASCH) protein
MQQLDGRVVTLRIKRKYFDAIKSGEKTAEYRDGKDFYVSLFEGPRVKFLKLHYQGRETLVVRVKSIRLIARPKRFVDSPMFSTKKIFKISLGRVVRG